MKNNIFLNISNFQEFEERAKSNFFSVVSSFLHLFYKEQEISFDPEIKEYRQEFWSRKNKFCGYILYKGSEKFPKKQIWKLKGESKIRGSEESLLFFQDQVSEELKEYGGKKGVKIFDIKDIFHWIFPEEKYDILQKFYPSEKKTFQIRKIQKRKKESQKILFFQDIVSLVLLFSFFVLGGILIESVFSPSPETFSLNIFGIEDMK